MVFSAPPKASVAAPAGSLFLCTAALFAPAVAAPLPEGMRAMIAKAVESDDPTVLATVLAVARQAAPDSLAEIEDAAAERPESAAAVAAEKAAAISPTSPPPIAVRPAAPIELAKVEAEPKPEWKGSVELGGARTAGTTDLLAAHGAVDLSRASGEWTQRLTAKADYQETDGAKSTERFSLAYQPQVRLRPELYAFGLGQYEHDRFLGYRNRYTLGVGGGVTVLDRPDFRIALDAGPVVRVTDFYGVDLDRESAVAGRGSVALKWLPTRRITISQEGAVYVEGAQRSAKSTTSVETLLFGPLKGKLSYDVQHERDARVNRSAVDTSTRASILYSF